LPGFDPKAKYHLIAEVPGQEVECSSYAEITDLCERAEQIINESRQSGLLPKLKILDGRRLPICGGPLPKVLVDGRWIPLVEDRSATVADCPEDGAILGAEEAVEENISLDHLDREKVPTDDDEERTLTVVGSARPSGESEARTPQIFGQDRGS